MKSIVLSVAAFSLVGCGLVKEPTSEQKAGSGVSLTVSVYANAPDIWPDNVKNSISYCVSKSFGSNYDRIVKALNSAIEDWESAGGFNYTHLSQYDANCNASTTAVTFDVTPVQNRDFLMRAFFPNEARPARNILVDSSSYSASDQALIGYFRHELGHTLGFRHEHIRVEGKCNEGGVWQPVTEYDSSSVMHYPHCPGGTGDIDNLVLTERDRNGVARIYPRAAPQLEDEYLVGDFDGDGRDNLAVRRGSSILYDKNFDGYHDGVIIYGDGNAESQYLVGDWNGDGKDNIAVRRGATIYFDTNGDGTHDSTQVYGDAGDVYMVGDWNGDRRDSLAVRRGNTVYFDNNFDGAADFTQAYGDGNGSYYTGDWNGDGRSNLGLQLGARMLFDNNYDGAHDFEQSYGDGESFLIGDWDGDGRDNIAIRRGLQVYMDTNFDGAHDILQSYGNGK